MRVLPPAHYHLHLYGAMARVPSLACTFTTCGTREPCLARYNIRATALIRIFARLCAIHTRTRQLTLLALLRLRCATVADGAPRRAPTPPAAVPGSQRGTRRISAAPLRRHDMGLNTRAARCLSPTACRLTFWAYHRAIESLQPRAAALVRW